MKKRKWIEWKLKKCDLMTMGGVIFAIFAVVLTVQCLLHHYLDSMFPLGAGIEGQVLVKAPWISAGFLAVSWVALDLYMSFDWAIGFGRTRKEFLRNSSLVYLTGTFLLLLESALLTHCGALLLQKFYGTDKSAGFGIDTLLELAAWSVLFTAAGGIAAWVVRRFGVKGGVGLMILFFFGMGLFRGEVVLPFNFPGLFETFFLIPELLKILIGIAGCEFWIFKFKKMQAN